MPIFVHFPRLKRDEGWRAPRWNMSYPSLNDQAIVCAAVRKREVCGVASPLNGKSCRRPTHVIDSKLKPSAHLVVAHAHKPEQSLLLSTATSPNSCIDWSGCLRLQWRGPPGREYYGGSKYAHD
jgi:hypothetical protein